MLLASVGETALLPLLEQAVPAAPPLQSKRLAQARPATRRMLLLTLLFLGVAGVVLPDAGDNSVASGHSLL